MMPGKIQQNQQLKKGLFLKAYCEDPNISVSCELAGIDRGTYYNWIAADDDFKEAVIAAEEVGIDELEREAFRRAKESSDTLMIFLLKNKRRGVYGEKLQIDAHVKHSGEEKREAVRDKLFKNKGDE